MYTTNAVSSYGASARTRRWLARAALTLVVVGFATIAAPNIIAERATAEMTCQPMAQTDGGAPDEDCTVVGSGGGSTGPLVPVPVPAEPGGGRQPGAGGGGTTKPAPKPGTTRVGTVVVIVTRDHGFGSHVAVYIKNGNSLILYDPGGTYSPRSESREGSAGYLTGADTNLEAYINYQRGTGSDVEIYPFTVSNTDAAAIIDRIAPSDMSNGEGEGWVFGIVPACAFHVSNVLEGIGPFHDLDTYYSPGSLADALHDLQVPLQ